MVLCGIQWDGYKMVLHPWYCMVLHGILHGIQWYYIALHSIYWYVMVLDGIQWDGYKMVLHPWYCVVVHGSA